MNFTAEDRGDHYLVDEGDGPFKLPKDGLDPDVDAKVRAAIGAAPGFASGGIVPAPILTPPLPSNAYQLLKKLYKPKEEKKDEERPDAGDDDDEPDAGVQSFNEAGVVLAESDPDAPTMSTVPASFLPSEPAPEPLMSVAPPPPQEPNLALGASSMFSDLDKSFQNVRDQRQQEALARVETEMKARPEQPLLHQLGDTIRDNLTTEPPPTKAPLGPDQTVPVREPLGPPPTWPGQDRAGAGGSVGIEYRPGVTSTKAYRPGADKGLADALAAKEQSALDVAAVEVDIAAQQQALAEQRERTIAEARESYLKDKAENDDLVKRQTDDIANTRIDPNALYGKMSTGQRVASTIALVLGGLGGTVQGVGRGGWDGKNVALDMINRAIDLDVQAQRDNLENKKSVLAEFIRRGHDIEGAFNMTKAYLLDIAAAQSDKLAAQHKGGVAAASAKGIAADIRIEGAKLRDEAMLRKTKIHYEPLLAQLEIDKAGMEEMKLRLAAHEQQMQQASIDDAKWRLFNRQATAEDAFLLEQIDPKSRERLLPLRNGQWAQLANGSESAFKIRDRLAINAEGRNVLNKLLEIANDPDEGRRLGGFRTVSDLLATEDMINKIRGSGLGAYDKGLATFLQTWATNPRQFFARLDATRAAIEEKIRLNEEGENEFLDSVLFSPRQASSGVKVLGRASTGGR